MVCEYCNKGQLVEGTLEGVSFKPSSEQRKWLSGGVYGIMVKACLECGRLSQFGLDTESLKKIVKK